MELSQKTTILLSPAQHRRLKQLAAERRTSIGELVRAACERQYGLASADDAEEAVRELAALELPVAEPGEMKRESVPSPDPRLP